MHKFHPDPIWSDGALRNFVEGCPNKNRSSDMRSVADLKKSPYIRYAQICLYMH